MQSAGFSLRLMIGPIPTNTDLRVNSIPDWKAKQPFSVQWLCFSDSCRTEGSKQEYAGAKAIRR
jgi:hypothetical protein